MLHFARKREARCTTRPACLLRFLRSKASGARELGERPDVLFTVFRENST
jgi:hypothetical protein